MRNVGSLATFNRQQVPPVKTPAVHQRERPLVLNPLLDPACELCLLPIQGAVWHDYSENGNDGALVGSVWTGNGRYGPAVEGNAAADRVLLGLAPNVMFVAGDFTLEIWFNLTAIPGGSFLLGRGAFNVDGYGIYVNAAGAFSLYTSQALFNQVSASAAGAIVVNQWYHAVGRRQGVAAEVFINGFDATAVAGVHINPVGNPARQAAVGQAGANTLIGYCDLAGIYSRRLGDQEILDLYNQGRPQWM